MTFSFSSCFTSVSSESRPKNRKQFKDKVSFSRVWSRQHQTTLLRTKQCLVDSNIKRPNEGCKTRSELIAGRRISERLLAPCTKESCTSINSNLFHVFLRSHVYESGDKVEVNILFVCTYAYVLIKFNAKIRKWCACLWSSMNRRFLASLIVGLRRSFTGFDFSTACD